MSFGHPLGRGRIPLHRSVRHVRFGFNRLLAWLCAALAITGVQLLAHRGLLQAYRTLVEGLLDLAQVPFEPGPVSLVAGLAIPSWSIQTFNPVAVPSGALAYGLLGLVLAVGLWRIPRLPFPLVAWLSLVGILLLTTTLLLALHPLPQFTPEVFAGMWVKVAVATSLVFPWFWVLLVGVLPLPAPRVAFWGLAAWLVFGLWNILRLAFLLALARAAGVVWLPLAFMLGGTLPDCFVFILFFSRVLEPAGQEWEEPL